MKIFRIKYISHGAQAIIVVAVSVEEAFAAFRKAKSCPIISITQMPEDVIVTFSA